MAAVPLKKPQGPASPETQAREAFRRALEGRRTLADRVVRTGAPLPELDAMPEVDGDPDVAATRRVHRGPESDPTS